MSLIHLTRCFLNVSVKKFELFKCISQNNACFSLVDLEIITDANVDKLELKSLKKIKCRKDAGNLSGNL